MPSSAWKKIDGAVAFTVVYADVYDHTLHRRPGVVLVTVRPRPGADRERPHRGLAVAIADQQQDVEPVAYDAHGLHRHEGRRERDGVPEHVVDRRSQSGLEVRVIFDAPR